jgi:hypothetical protein
MTREEHQLMIEMFHQQDMLMAALVEALKSKEVLDQGDIAAYDALIAGRGDEVRTRLRSRVEESYQEAALFHGVRLPT